MNRYKPRRLARTRVLVMRPFDNGTWSLLCCTRTAIRASLCVVTLRRRETSVSMSRLRIRARIKRRVVAMAWLQLLLFFAPPSYIYVMGRLEIDDVPTNIARSGHTAAAFRALSLIAEATTTPRAFAVVERRLYLFFRVLVFFCMVALLCVAVCVWETMRMCRSWRLDL